jgi:hypothetical protein
MLCWFRKHFERPARPPERRAATAGVHVRHDDKTITVRQTDGTVERISWADLGSVTIVTTEKGPFAADLFWVLADRSGRRAATIPVDAPGEHDLVKAMQSRLHGFDNMAVVEAMSTTGDASFLIWDHARREPGPALS